MTESVTIHDWMKEKRMKNTIPKKVLIAVPDFSNPSLFQIVGPEKAFIPAFDRSFHFGDSVYEVTRSYDGILFSLEEHIERLKASAKLGMFEEFPSEELIARMIRETCQAFFRKFGNMDVYVRITLSRGFGDLNIDPKYSSSPYALVYVKELDTIKPEAYVDGYNYAVVTRRRNPPVALDPAMKSGNYLNNVLAIAEATKMGAVDALMLSTQGFVTEGTTNNFYAVKNGTILTAPLSVGILAGITRDWIFTFCKNAGIPVEERLFTESELRDCQECFMSSSTKEVVGITQLNGVPVGNGKPGPITRKVHQGLKGIIREYIQKHKSESLYI